MENWESKRKGRTRMMMTTKGKVWDKGHPYRKGEGPGTVGLKDVLPTWN